MIELRCGNNQKLGEIDPASLSLVFKCKRCTDVWKRPVFHPVPIGKILNAIGRGLNDGAIYVDGEAEACGNDVH